jgi:mycothiol system anti-sigma-R factor
MQDKEERLGRGYAGEPTAPPWSVPLDPCQEAISTLYVYLDGELTAERRQQIQRHLDECSPCLQAFGFEAELKALIAKKCHDEVPESLRRRVARALGAEEPPCV